MKTFVAVCLLACAAALPQELASIEGSGEPPVEIATRSFNIDSIDNDILRSEFEMADDGQFQYGFETRDGIVVDAAGENRQIGDGVGAVMRGSYSYTSPEGIDVTINWEADENGFRASGDQVPAVPEYVTRLLKTLPAEPQAAGAVRAAEQAVAAVEEEAAVVNAAEGAAPAAEDVAPATEDAAPATEDAAPATEDAAPTTEEEEDAAPATEDAAPATEDAAPATEDAAPATEDAAPATEDAAPPTEDAAPAEGAASVSQRGAP